MKIWSDKLHACNKQIHQDILNFCCFQLKYEPLIFNNTSSSVKSILCCPLTSKSTNIFAENSFRLFPLVIDLCIFLSWFRWDDVFTGESNITSQVVNWWTGVMWITCGILWCFYQLFGLSFWRHPFTAEDPLVSKWFNAKFSKSDQIKKQTHLHLGWLESEYIFSYFSFLGSNFLLRMCEF